MKKPSMITNQIFRLQLSSQIILYLHEKGFINCNDEQAEEAMYSLARFFKSGIDLEDFSFEFTVTDKGDNKKFIA